MFLSTVDTAVITVSPSAIPVTTPFLSTDAAFSLLEDHVTVVLSVVSAGVGVILNVFEAPIFTLSSPAIVIPVSGTLS